MPGIATGRAYRCPRRHVPRAAPYTGRVFGINGNEFIVILLVAVIVVGPRRLPEYTRKLTQLIRQLRVFLEQAKAQIAEEVGPELGDLNLADLNPRNYDPRKIVRDALGEDLDAIKRDLANPLAAVASTAKEASDAVAADVRALAAQERSDSLGKRIEAQAEAARAGAEAEAAQAKGAQAEAAQGTGTGAETARVEAEEARKTGAGVESAQAEAGAETAQVAEAKSEETRAEVADTVRGPEPGTGEEPVSDTTPQSDVQEPAVPGTESPEGARGTTAGEMTRPAPAATGPVAGTAAQAGPDAGTVPAGSQAEVADVARGSEPGAGEEPMSDTTPQAGSAETAPGPQAEVSQEQDTTPDDQEQTAAQPVVQGRDTAPGEQRPDVLQEQQDATPGEQRAAAPDDQEQDAVVTGSRDGQTATSEAAAIPTSLTEASGDLPPRPLSPRDIVRAAKAAARTRPEAATLTVDA